MIDYTGFIGLKCIVRNSAGHKYYGTVTNVDGNANFVWLYLSNGDVTFEDNTFSKFARAFVLGVIAIETLEIPK